MKLAAGNMVTDKLRLREPLGRGAMGEVWVADHLSLEMPVAVKFIHADLIVKFPEMLTRFKREAKAAAHIKSPHAVQIIDHGVSDDDTAYIVMELLEGNTLSQWLELVGTLSYEDTAKIVSQVAGVLHKAHRAGIVHRDIKPDNIFLVDDEADLFVKVLDFGVAKREATKDNHKVTAHGAVLGTPLYMSPEQALSAKDVDAQADLWALAVVAYEAMAGEPPFLAESLGALVVSITTSDFEPISRRLDERYPATIDDFFTQAFHPRPEERFASAHELAAAFQQLARRLPSEYPTQLGQPAPATKSPRTESPKPRPPAAQPLAVATTQAAAAPTRSASTTRKAKSEVTSTLRSIEDEQTPAPRDPPRIAVEDARPRRGYASGDRQDQRRRRPRQGAGQGERSGVDPAHRDLIAVIVIVVATSMAAPFLEAIGQSAIGSSVPGAPYLPFAIAALLFVIAGAKVWDHSSGHGGTLKIAGGGMLLLGLALGATAVTIGAPQLGFDSYAATIELVGGVAATAVPLGFALYGALRALEELTHHPRNLGYGMLLLIMSAVALMAAYQLSRRPLEHMSASAGGSSPAQRA